MTETPVKAEEKKVETPVKAEEKKVETPVKVEEKKVETPVKVEEKKVETTVKVEEKKVETPVKIEDIKNEESIDISTHILSTDEQRERYHRYIIEELRKGNWIQRRSADMYEIFIVSMGRRTLKSLMTTIIMLILFITMIAIIFMIPMIVNVMMVIPKVKQRVAEDDERILKMIARIKEKQERDAAEAKMRAEQNKSLLRRFPIIWIILLIALLGGVLLIAIVGTILAIVLTKKKSKFTTMRQVR
jgi:hypothetical protein